MSHQSSHPFRKLFPAAVWTKTTAQLCAITLLTILWFNLEWCMIFSFTTFQIPEMWVNTFLAAFILTIPQIIWKMPRTQAAIITLLAILLECNLLYARTYFTAIPASSYLMAGNLADFTASVVDSLRWADLGFAAIIALAWLRAIHTPRKQNTKPSHAFIAWLWPVLLLALASAGMLIRRGGITKAWNELSVYKYYSSRVPMYTVAGSVVHDLMQAATPLTPQEKQEVITWFAQQPTLDSIPGAHRHSIILIMCESLESWPIGLEIQGKEITPNLNRLAADSTALFAPNVASQVGAGRSIDAQLLLNAGMLPMEAGIYATDHFQNTYHSLAKALKQQRNAKTLLLTVDKPHTWNQEAVAKAFGIDTLLANTHWPNTQPVGSKKKLGDRAFAQQITRQIEQGKLWPRGENVYMQIVTYSGHNPFRLPENLDSLNLSTERLHPIVHRYLTMAHYTDAALGQLVEGLKKHPDYKNTLIVITGDHEGLAFERKRAAHTNPFVDSRQIVPLIILNSPVTGKINKTVGQIDIYPTILQLAGLTAYHWHGMGQSILAPTHPGVAITSQHNPLGNTDSVSPETLRHLLDARHISNTVIKHNMLNNQKN